MKSCNIETAAALEVQVKLRNRLPDLGGENDQIAHFWNYFSVSPSNGADLVARHLVLKSAMSIIEPE